MLDQVVGAKVDHVAIAVRDIGRALRLYGDTLGATFLFAGDEPASGFRWAQFRFPGGGKIEFVTPLREDSFVATFLAGRGEGVHHLTLKVPDIAEALAALRASGVEPVGVSIEQPGWKEAFIHPRDANGALIQLAEADWSDEDMARHHLEAHGEDDHRHVLLEEILRPNHLFVREPADG